MRFGTPASMVLALSICCPAWLPAYAGDESGADVFTLVPDDAVDNQNFGYSVSGMADFDGDGYDDVLVGAPRDNDAGFEGGAVYVYYGSEGGIDIPRQQKLTGSVGDEWDMLGYSVSATGDINGDGYDDAIIGAWGDNTYSGSAYVYYGSDSGLDPSSEQKFVASDRFPYDHYGVFVSVAGDINGDGYDDVVIGAHGYDNYDGAAYIYYGSALGVSTSTEVKLVAPNSQYGVSVAGAGDINGDGYDDVLVGANGGGNYGSAYLYYGSDDGLDPSSELELLASDTDLGDNYGISVSSAGDIDGDGYADVIIGAKDDKYSGSAYLYYGSERGLDLSSEQKILASDELSGLNFGSSVSGVGDIDGDGYDDVIIGAEGGDFDGANSGAAYVYHGSAAGLDTTSEERLLAPDGTERDQFGNSVSGAGDVDGDGFGDLIVSAYMADKDGIMSGAAYVFINPLVDDEAEGDTGTYEGDTGTYPDDTGTYEDDTGAADESADDDEGFQCSTMQRIPSGMTWLVFSLGMLLALRRRSANQAPSRNTTT